MRTENGAKPAYQRPLDLQADGIGAESHAIDAADTIQQEKNVIFD
jgi:hypothetical protein